MEVYGVLPGMEGHVSECSCCAELYEELLRVKALLLNYRKGEADAAEKRQKRAKQITLAWMRYHYKYPEVWSQIKAMAFAAHAERRTDYGIGMVWERIRWDSASGASASDLEEMKKCANDYKTIYNMMIISLLPSEVAALFHRKKGMFDELLAAFDFLPWEEVERWREAGAMPQGVPK